MRHIIGVHSLMWGSDYPHAESTWPRSQEILEHILRGVPEDEAEKIAGGNAAELYHFDYVRAGYLGGTKNVGSSPQGIHTQSNARRWEWDG